MPTPRLVAKTLQNSDGTSEVQIGFVGAAVGTRVTEIQVTSGPTTAPGTGILTLILNDGSNSYPYRELTLTNTANYEQGTWTFPNLTLPSTSWNLRAQMRTAITSGGTVSITVKGRDLD